jgi:transaldolase
MELAGVDHITISPALLDMLARNPAPPSATESRILTRLPLETENKTYGPYADRASEYKIEFTLSDEGEGERKLGQAIRIFCEMQKRFETFVEQVA